jgi:hypothetical protein
MATLEELPLRSAFPPFVLLVVLEILLVYLQEQNYVTEIGRTILYHRRRGVRGAAGGAHRMFLASRSRSQ